MSKIKTRGNPVMWKSQMLKGVTPTRESHPVVYTEPHKRRATKDFDFTEVKGFVEDVEVNALDAFELIINLNEKEARTAVSLSNHQHLRKRQDLIIAADLAYRESLSRFNVCGNCMLPIRTKKANIKVGTDVNNLIPMPTEYADIPEHYRVYQHPTKARKFFYQKVPKTRVFNQKCGCGIS